MPLADDIRALRDRTLADLIAAHDYFHDTRQAWFSVVEASIAEGNSRFANPVTGTSPSAAELIVKAERYIAVELAEATFQQFLAIFEAFFFDLLRLWLTAYPQSLGKKTIDFRTILDLHDKEAITDLIVTRELVEVAYGRPTTWFAYLEEKAKPGCPAAGEIERIAEAKASRDLLIHNRGVANAAYQAKAGPIARFHDGERIEIAGPYHRATWELLCKVVHDLADSLITKLV